MRCTVRKIWYYLIVIKKDKNKNNFLYQGGYRKLSKSVLAGSLATAGIVLGAIAPAITAQAATGSGKTNADGSVTYQDPTTKVGALGDKDSSLAIAFDEMDTDGTTVKTVGQASAQSNANVTVQSGLLTLDSVPDFGFANAAEGTTVALDNNNYDDKAADSQGTDKLTVTESRTGEPGFSVDASISTFTPKGATDQTGAKPYILNLASTRLKDDKGGSVGTQGAVNTGDINISGDSTNTNSTSAASGTVINLTKGSYKPGAINASFNKDADDAFLNLDKGKTTGTTTGTKSYNATITWTLTAAPKTTTEAGK